MRRLTIFFASGIVAILLIIGSGKQAVVTALATRAATASATPTTVPLAVELAVSGTYFHPSGIFSLPLLNGWDLSPDYESQIVPTLFKSYTRVETAFVNGTVSSVVVAYAEKLSSVRLTSIKDANSYFDTAYFSDVWTNYSGGFQETARRIERDRLIIEFKGSDLGRGYLARQVSRLEKDWLLTVRTVVPDNNPQLLNRLDQKLTSGMIFYPNLAAAPLNWATLRDITTPTPPYFVKYPAQWVFNPEANTVGGVLSNETILLSVTTENSKTIATAQNARTWVTTAQANAKVLTVKPETRGSVTGFSVSYQYANADGKTQNAVATLLNGANNRLYALTIKTSVQNVDLLSSAADSLLPDLARVRGSFTVLPAGSYLSLPRAKVQPTNSPTQTLAPNPQAFDIKTAQIYRSPDRILEMKLPKGWTPNVRPNYRLYTFSVEPTSNPYIVVRFYSLVELYQDLHDEYDISIDPDGLTIEALLKPIRDQYVADKNAEYTPIRPIRVGSFSGFGFAYQPKSGKVSPYPIYEIRMAALPQGQVVYVHAGGDQSYNEKAATVITAMLDSLVINADRIPTPTITPTPYPLLLTATALQGQFNALTASPTYTPISSATSRATATSTPGTTVTPTPTVVPTTARSASPTIAPTQTITAF